MVTAICWKPCMTLLQLPFNFMNLASKVSLDGSWLWPELDLPEIPRYSRVPLQCGPFYHDIHTALQWQQQNINQTWNTHTHRHPIPCPNGWAMGCLLWQCYNGSALYFLTTLPLYDSRDALHFLQHRPTHIFTFHPEAAEQCRHHEEKYWQSGRKVRWHQVKEEFRVFTEISLTEPENFPLYS